MRGCLYAFIPENGKDVVSLAHALVLPRSVKYSVPAKRARWRMRKHPKMLHAGWIEEWVKPYPDMVMIDFSKRGHGLIKVRKVEEDKEGA